MNNNTRESTMYTERKTKILQSRGAIRPSPGTDPYSVVSLHSSTLNVAHLESVIRAYSTVTWTLTVCLAKHSVLDFNFHSENVENNNSRKLHDIDMFKLTQSISEPTHNQGHLLDLMFSKQSDNILISTKLHHGLTSDHTAILCKLDVSVPVQKPETFSYRCLRKIDTGAFKQDLSHAVSQFSSISDYNNHLCSVLDKHTPLCHCTVRTRKPTPWFSSIAEQFCELKREHRQAEIRWLKSKLTVHKQIYESIEQKVTNLADKAKQAYYSAKIQSSTTCKQLFQNFNTILGKSRSSPLPSTFDSGDLPNVFSDL